MATPVLSFHRLRDLCLADDPSGWRGFVRQYTSLVTHLAQHYFPGLPQPDFVVNIFREARANQAAWLRGFSGTTEGEFLLALRRFLLSLGRAHQQAPATPFTLEAFWALLQEFPPLQREMILLTLRGYSPEEINRMHRFEQSSGQQILDLLLEKSASLLGQSFRDDLLRMNHDALFASIEQQPTDKCVPDRTYVRLFDGQVSWREKENFELHIESCLYCLARLAEYREVFYYFQKLPAADPARLSEIGAAVGLLPERAEKPRGLARLILRLGRSARKV